MLRHNVEAYLKGYNIDFVSKAIQHKPYSDLQSLLILTY